MTYDQYDNKRNLRWRPSCALTGGNDVGAQAFPSVHNCGLHIHIHRLRGVRMRINARRRRDTTSF